MKHTFRPSAHRPTHRRITDDVTGVLSSHPDTVTIRPPSALVALEDFIELDAPPVAEPVPFEIASWRAKAVLEIAGLLDDVEAALTTMPGDAGVVARAAWQSGAPLVRRGATVTALAAQLSLSDEQVDQMFRQAAALTV